MAEKDTGIYVISAPGCVSGVQADAIRERLGAEFPDKKFVILGDGMHLYRVETAPTEE